VNSSPAATNDESSSGSVGNTESPCPKSFSSDLDNASEEELTAGQQIQNNFSISNSSGSSKKAAEAADVHDVQESLDKMALKSRVASSP